MKGDEPRLEGAYAVDAVTDAERERHHAAMRDDHELSDETASLSAAATELSRLSATEPPPALRASVLAAIGQVRPLPPVLTDSEPVPTEPDNASVVEIRRRRRTPLIAALVAAAAAITAIVVVIGQRDTEAPNPTAAVMSASDLSSYHQPIDDWTATVYVAPSQDKALIMSDAMPDAPSGHDFQVWLVMPGDKMVSAGVMPRTNGKGQEFMVSGGVDEATAVAVSVEPAGGSQQPTTKPVLVINL